MIQEKRTLVEANSFLRELAEKEKNITLSIGCKIAPITVSHWKRGLDLTFEQCVKIAKYFGYSTILKFEKK